MVLNMLFNSLEFLVFFPIIILIYFILPKKVRYIWLLAASYFFYMCWNAKYAILLFFSTLVTYLTSIGLEEIKNKNWDVQRIIKCKKFFVSISLLLNLSVLFVFKYMDFIFSYVERFFEIIHIDINMPAFDFILPVGISFYTFQAIGYTIDVYRDEIRAEKNFLRYALFISFFPQLVAGPIERSKNLLLQLEEDKILKKENVRVGILYILWGLFLKMTIADRAAIIVNTVYDNPQQYPGFYIVVATIMFAFQIYCDFYGYSIIAKGSALILDIHLMDNFNAPYLARSVKEFWKRWHISLSSWFRDYLYIPLGGNRKGFLRKEANLLCVFGISGLWHGAAWGYVAWGLLNGGYQVISNLFSRYFGHKPSAKIEECSASTVCRQRLTTFSLVCFAWIFFRAADISKAISVIKNMFCFNWYILFDGTLFTLGVREEIFLLLCVFIGVLLIVDHMKYKGISVIEKVMEQELWAKILIYVTLFFIIVMFGCYGVEYDTNQFIYFQF